MSNTTTRGRHRGRRRRVVPALWAAGAVAAIVLTLTVNGTISGFTASVSNTANSISTGTLTLLETGPDSTGVSTTCSSTSGGGTCATINKYGNTGVAATALAPGQSVTTTVTLKNTGTTDASTFTLTPGVCASSGSGSGNLCGELQLTITGTGLTPAVTNQTLDAFRTAGASTVTGGLAAGATKSFTFTVTFPSSADNTYQGLTATQTLTWQILT